MTHKSIQLFFLLSHIFMFKKIVVLPQVTFELVNYFHFSSAKKFLRLLILIKKIITTLIYSYKATHALTSYF